MTSAARRARAMLAAPISPRSLAVGVSFDRNFVGVIGGGVEFARLIPPPSCVTGKGAAGMVSGGASDTCRGRGDELGTWKYFKSWASCDPTNDHLGLLGPIATDFLMTA